jgi:hypothetical protein
LAVGRPIPVYLDRQAFLVFVGTSQSADIVAKAENRPTPKISQKLIFNRLRRCNTR